MVEDFSHCHSVRLFDRRCFLVVAYEMESQLCMAHSYWRLWLQRCSNNNVVYQYVSNVYLVAQRKNVWQCLGSRFEIVEVLYKGRYTYYH